MNRRTLLLFLLVSTTLPACANIPLPTLFAFNLPLVMGLSIFAAVLTGVIVVEAAALRLMFRQPFMRSIVVAASANLLSSAIGGLLSIHPLEMLGLIALLICTVHFTNTRFQWSAGKRYAFALGLIVLLVLFISPWSGIPAAVIQIYMTFILAFALTVLLEAFILAGKDVSPRLALRRSFGMNLFSYLCLAVLLYVIGFRSGAFAEHEWFVWKLRTTSYSGMNRGKILSELEEFYLWQASGKQMRSAEPYMAAPILELSMVQSWAGKGDTEDARELLELVKKYNQRNPENPMWQIAEDAIRDAATTGSQSQSR